MASLVLVMEGYKVRVLVFCQSIREGDEDAEVGLNFQQFSCEICGDLGV